MSQLLGFNPFTDYLLLLPVGDLSLEDLAKKSVQVGKTAHGIVYNPQLDKYAITNRFYINDNILALVDL